MINPRNIVMKHLVGARVPNIKVDKYGKNKYCDKCGYGIGSQGHEDCCVKKKSTYTRNNNRINNWAMGDQDNDNDADFAFRNGEYDNEVDRYGN